MYFETRMLESQTASMGTHIWSHMTSSVVEHRCKIPHYLWKQSLQA